MIAVFTSLLPPTSDDIVRARNTGIQVWNGYLSVNANVNLPTPSWARGDFATAQTLSPSPLAFVSGWDDPLAIKTLAAAWGVRPTLLVMDGIRTEGSWIKGFLTDSGAGIAGPAQIHHWDAPWHVLVASPGYDPQATWNGAAPNTPNGWQWDITHGWYDDWYLGDDDMFDATDRTTLGNVAVAASTAATLAPQLQQQMNVLTTTVDALQGAVARLSGPAPVNTDALAQALVPLLTPHLTDVSALAAALAPLLAPSLPPAVKPLDIATAVATVMSQRLSGG